MKNQSSSEKTKKQCVTISISSIIVSIINGIISYIAVYFFRPVWDKLVKWWKNEV